MRIPRLYLPVPLTQGETLSLPADQAAHVTSVLRLKAGAPVRVFDGAGHEHAAALEGTGRRTAVRVGEALPALPESPLRLTLAQGIGRGERMDFVVQKATELGVTAIVPLLTARAVVRLDDERSARRLAHWQAVAVSACEQCGRAMVPTIATPVALADFLRQAPQGAGVLLEPTADAPLATLTPPGAVTVLIGPEGGLDTHEQAAACAAGYTPVRLGPRVLRTETAALAALTLLQARAGDLG